MKRAYILLAALLLLLTGCAGKGQNHDVSVKDVCCPYDIRHKEDAVELTLWDGEQSGILWSVESVPEELVQVAEEEAGQEFTSRYRLTGMEEGAAKLTFTARQPDETVCFVLSLIVNVDAEGKAFVSTHQHQERKETAVDADGLTYEWNVDTNGILNFSFINQEENWSVAGDGGEVFVFSNMMSTSYGCKFSAQATAGGETTVILSGNRSQRTVHVLIRADDSGKMEVVSVQEQ